MVLNLIVDNPAVRIIAPQVFPFMRVFGVGIFSISLLSKLLRIAITREAMKSANQTNDYPDTDFE